MKNHGSGGVRVYATDSVDITLTGSGDVDVWGNPTDRTESDTGSGNVVYH